MSFSKSSWHNVFVFVCVFLPSSLFSCLDSETTGISAMKFDGNVVHHTEIVPHSSRQVIILKEVVDI